MNHSYVYPGLGCLGQSFVVLAQPTAASQPCQCSFDDPSSWQHLEMMAVSRTPHNLQYPARCGQHPINQLTGVTSVRPYQLQVRKPSYQLIDDQLCAISVLDVSRMNHDGQQQPYGVHDDVTLAPHHLLTSIIATRPPFSVVFTDWLSMMAALGVGLLPSDCRTLGRSDLWTPSHVPSSVHLRKYLYTVCQAGRSCGSIRHGHPVRSTYRMPLTTSRVSTVRGRPPGLAGGSKGSIMSHCSSVRSLGYDLRVIHQSLRL